MGNKPSTENPRQKLESKDQTGPGLPLRQQVSLDTNKTGARPVNAGAKNRTAVVDECCKGSRFETKTDTARGGQLHASAQRRREERFRS